VARILVVGAPGRARELESSGHVVEDAAGVDPDRLATLTPRLEGVTVVCWLFGEDGRAALHGDRLGTLLEYLVDTPVRGFVYEGQAGAAAVRAASARWWAPSASAPKSGSSRRTSTRTR
jgi:hypothetical protein